MGLQDIHLPKHHFDFTDRFIEACLADERVLAVTLYGSCARGEADAYSDLDLGLITTDEANEGFVVEREIFLRQLGELVFLEDFGSPVALFIYSNGVEGELSIGRESQFHHIHDEPYKVLLDKKGILASAVFRHPEPAQAEQTEILRRQVYWFWHDLSHFITAMGRGQLWWAQGQLEILREICVNLARLKYNFSDPNVGEEVYFKVEKAIPVELLSPLEVTFCPLEKKAMLRAAQVIVNFYLDITPLLARSHGIAYPADLERVMTDRMRKLEAV